MKNQRPLKQALFGSGNMFPEPKYAAAYYSKGVYYRAKSDKTGDKYPDVPDEEFIVSLKSNRIPGNRYVIRFQLVPLWDKQFVHDMYRQDDYNAMKIVSVVDDWQLVDLDRTILDQTCRWELFGRHFTFNGDVLVWPNAKMNYRAAQSIRLKPGFHAQHGSKFHAKIEPCNVGTYKYAGESSENNGKGERAIAESFTTPVVGSENSFSVYPNPSESGEFTIEMAKTSGVLRIFNASGTLVYYNQNFKYRDKVQLLQRSGLYLVELYDGKQYFTRKIIVN